MQEKKRVDNSDIVIGHREFKLSPNVEAQGFIESVWMPNLPQEMKKWVLGQLVHWRLISQPTDFSDDTYLKLLAEANKKLQTDEIVLSGLPGYEERHEVEYTEDEKKLEPIFSHLENSLAEKLTFKLYFESINFTFIVIRENGTRQVMRITQLQRPLDQIVADIQKVGDLFPPIQLVPLGDGETAVLVDWVEGHMPLNEEERQRCLQAAAPLSKLKRAAAGTRDWIMELDLNNSNFVITDAGHIYVIDQHPILNLISDGFQ